MPFALAAESGLLIDGQAVQLARSGALTVARVHPAAATRTQGVDAAADAVADDAVEGDAALLVAFELHEPRAVAAVGELPQEVARREQAIAALDLDVVARLDLHVAR